MEDFVLSGVMSTFGGPTRGDLSALLVSTGDLCTMQRKQILTIHSHLQSLTVQCTNVPIEEGADPEGESCNHEVRVSSFP